MKASPFFTKPPISSPFGLTFIWNCRIVKVRHTAWCQRGYDSKEVMMTLELFLWLTGFAVTVVFGVGAIVWGFTFLTNRRIDDLKTEIKDLFTAKLEPLQNQVENHLPSQIKELREKEDRDFKELKTEMNMY